MKSPAQRGKDAQRNHAKAIAGNIAIAIVGSFFVGVGDIDAAEPESSKPPAYQLLRYDEDYSYLRDPAQRTNLFDSVKFIPLNRSASSYLTLGGEIRERYEFFENYNWGLGPQTSSGYLLQRYMVHGDLHVGENVRFFTQFKSGLEDGRNGGPRPPDRDDFDLHQAFLDLTGHPGGDNSLTLRLGRQEMAFGSQRLVSVREGPNVRQSFDGGRLTVRAEGWTIDGIATRPVETNPGAFDDRPDPARMFWGLYGVHSLPVLPGGNIDLYYFGLDRKHAVFNRGRGHELRHSIGTRVWGSREAWDYNTEGVYQFGGFADGDIEAWTVATDTGYTFREISLRPRLAAKIDVASGDGNPHDQTLGTFNALFPKGAYFSETDLIGPANIIDLHPYVELFFPRQIKFTFDWDFFWRESTDDGIYGIAVNLVRPGQRSGARYIGSQPQAKLDWEISRHFNATLVYAHFFPGEFLKQTPPGKDVDYVSAWVGFKF